MNIDPKYKSYASVIAATFLSAFLTKLAASTDGTIPPESQWKAAGFVAAIACLSAVLHLLQMPPALASSAYKAKLAAQRTIAILLLASGLGTIMCTDGGCTKEQGTQVANTVRQVLSDLDKACVVGEEVAPALGLPQPTVRDVQVFCNLEQVASSDIESFIAQAGPGIAKAKSNLAAKLMAQKKGAVLAAPPPIPGAH